MNKNIWKYITLIILLFIILPKSVLADVAAYPEPTVPNIFGTLNFDFSFPIIMVICLISTIIIELVFSLLMGVRTKLDITNIILVNILTNPLVTSIPFYINLKFGILGRNIVLVILELFAVLFEGKIYKKYLDYDKINPYCLSIILNVCSYFIGLAISNIVF